MAAANLIDAVVAYLRSSMATELGDTVSTPKVFNTYAASVAYPYATVFNPQETYEFQSGSPPTYIADGQMIVTFYATSDTQAQALARSCIIHFMAEESGGDGDLQFSTGTSLEFRPQSSQSFPIMDEGVQSPTCFARAVTFHFREQFPTV